MRRHLHPRLRVLKLELDGQRAKPEGIPPEMLRRLVRLCHPDRHSQSEAANQATAWLLAQRASRGRAKA